MDLGLPKKIEKEKATFFINMKLPIELIENIVTISGDFNVASALADVISNSVLAKFEKNILVYGQVQGGKTKAIIEALHSTRGLKVLVIQNSLLVLEQYIARLRAQNFQFQVIDKYTKDITQDIVIVMANIYRYNYFLQLIRSPVYTLIMDEADQTFPRCPLKGQTRYFVTATPDTLYKNLTFDETINLKPSPDYYGMSSLDLKVADPQEAIGEFLETPTGMMLCNHLVYVEEMTTFARDTATRLGNVPVVLLSDTRMVFTGSAALNIASMKSITSIIDSLSNIFTHIIFVAHRLSNRGLSYTSSDFTRHLTHQYSRHKEFTQFYQTLRILGIYTDKPRLTLYVSSQSEKKCVERHLRRENNYSLAHL